MQFTTTSLADLIDRALFELEAPSERGVRVVMGDTALDSVEANEFELSSGALNVSDLVEFGSEMLLVTSKSADTSPVYGCARGYYSTTPAVQAAGAVGVVNPQFARRRVADAVDRSFTRLEGLGVVPVRSLSAFPEVAAHLDLAADVRRVLRVMYIGPTGNLVELDGWRQFSNVPSGLSPAGNVLQLPWYVTVDDELHLTYEASFGWTGTFPDETATVDLPAPAADLPAVFAAAWLVSGREISRAEIDRSNEHTTQDQVRVQSGTGLVRAKWQEFYRSLDEALRVMSHDIPKHRPYIRRPKVRI